MKPIRSAFRFPDGSLDISMRKVHSSDAVCSARCGVTTHKSSSHDMLGLCMSRIRGSAVMMQRGVFGAVHVDLCTTGCFICALFLIAMVLLSSSYVFICV
jgi:hypothetical protein